MILAVVDVFEALTSHRSYRNPMDESEAMQYLDDNCGLKFDPDMIITFKNL